MSENNPVLELSEWVGRLVMTCALAARALKDKDTPRANRLLRDEVKDFNRSDVACSELRETLERMLK